MRLTFFRRSSRQPAEREPCCGSQFFVRACSFSDHFHRAALFCGVTPIRVERSDPTSAVTVTAEILSSTTCNWITLRIPGPLALPLLCPNFPSYPYDTWEATNVTSTETGWPGGSGGGRDSNPASPTLASSLGRSQLRAFSPIDADRCSRRHFRLATVNRDRPSLSTVTRAEPEATIEHQMASGLPSTPTQVRRRSS
jgi:hypothetical protein